MRQCREEKERFPSRSLRRRPTALGSAAPARYPVDRLQGNEGRKPMGLLRKLFGGGEPAGAKAAAKEGEAVEYKSFRIHPAAPPQGGQWLTAGVIRKEIDGAKIGRATCRERECQYV